MQFIVVYVRYRWKLIASFFLFAVIFLGIFAMYHLPLEAVLYPFMLCVITGLILLGINCYKLYTKHRQLKELYKQRAEVMEIFPDIDSLEDADYQAIIRKLLKEQRDMVTNMNTRYVEMIDYYTVWAHQIKTPIASMRLNLQNEDSAFSKKIAEDLLRIEQYVEMVLMFLRLDSDFTDYVIRECDLDFIIKQSVKKFSTQFIRRNIKLCYNPVEVRVVTDEKWLSFVIEQVLSNALKYTAEGTITIEMEEPKTLCIRDTGIGIAKEDLPRIFEKGYTGYNGRTDKKASGIGLYLCKRISNNLGHTIIAESDIDKGTTIYIGLEQRKLEVE